MPDDVAEAFDVVLSEADDPVHRALRAQLPYVRVYERCSCGCGSAYFEEIDPAVVAPAPVERGTRVAVDAQYYTEAGDLCGEILLFTRHGHLSWLEVCSYTDDRAEGTLAFALRALREGHTWPEENPS
ncbi:hypothetical protein [Streptomyces sp. NPDC090025]|uniref:hypothetical protein n=1 Tax=Streptomyces sp. NPDC090025 TaxID=3365922 RepID=UPI00383270BA